MCVIGLFLFSLPYLRRRVYEISLRVHQILGYVLLYAVWRHLPSSGLVPRIYVIITLAFLLVAPALQFLLAIHRNGIFPSRGCPRALVSCGRHDVNRKDYSSLLIQVRITLPRPMKIKAGQYINLSMPAVSHWSWAQSHPFMVTSWSHEAQETLDLLIQPRRGFSVDLLKHARAASPGSASFLALITGPHGVSYSVSRYESVVLVADGLGIAATIPYLKKLIYSYNTSASRTRRVHLVWQIETLGKIATA